MPLAIQPPRLKFMKLFQLKTLLTKNGSRNVRFVLPTGSKVPPHAHVTEVARIDKKFIDCGGTFRTESVCRLQTWFSDDTDHRLTASKLVVILQKSASFLETEDIEVDVEHEAPFVSQFPIERIETANDSLNVILGVKHTACLAEDRCLPPALGKASLLTRLPSFKPGKCC